MEKTIRLALTGVLLCFAGCKKAPPPPPAIECQLDSGAATLKMGAIFSLSGSVGTTGVLFAQQTGLLKSEVNSDCGMIGTAELGAPLDILIADGQNDQTLTPTLVDQLVSQGVVGIVGAGGSNPSVTAGGEAFTKGIPFGAPQATADSLSGCTPDQLANPAVVKSATPTSTAGQCWSHQGYFFRTAAVSATWGPVVSTYIRSNYPNAKTAVLSRNDTTYPFAGNAFTTDYRAHSGTVAPDPQLYPSTPVTKATFTPIIKTLVANGADTVVFFGQTGELKAFLESWADLSVDGSWTKPSNFDTIRFVNVGSNDGSYADLSASALAIMANRDIGIETFTDPNSEGYLDWIAEFTAFDPTVSSRTIQSNEPRTYDTLMIMALAIVKANTTDPTRIKNEVLNVANPPGTVIHPGEFGKARALLLQGEDINYEGSSGSCDLAPNGNTLSQPFRVWGTNADGSLKVISMIAG